MIKRTHGQGLLNLLPVLLFAVLAACVLSVLLTGSKLYASLTQQDRAAYLNRTVQQYVCTKVRQAESPAMVSVEVFKDESALVLQQEIEGEPYLQRIYCHDGWLKELFSSADAEMSPEDGEQLLKLTAFSASLENDLLQISFQTDDDSHSFYLDLTEVAYEK